MTDTTEQAELDHLRALVIAQAKLLGRCEEAFRIILQASSAKQCHRTARRMRDELERHSNQKETT